MIVLLSVPAGQEVLIGAPANPIPSNDMRLIAESLDGVSGLVEAHLPQVFIERVMDTARQVLVLVIDHTENADAVVGEIGNRFQQILHPDSHLDLWPLTPSSGLLETIRSANCELLRTNGH